MIMAGFSIPVYGIPFGLAYLLIQSIGIRHQKALMVLISLEKEMSEVNVESGLQQPQQTPVVTYASEEQQPFLVHNQQLTEEEEMQHIIAMIEAQNTPSSEQQVNVPVPVPSPVPAAYASTMPQYPFVFPQQQQPFVYSPYQVNPVAATEQHQAYYPSPMMYTGMLPQPYPAMMVMMPPNTNTKQ